MIQITRVGVRTWGTEQSLEKLRREFDRRHTVRLPGILEPELLAVVLRGIDQAEFYERTHQAIGPNKELCLEKSPVVGLLHVLLNGEDLFRTIRRITGCGSIGCFDGRVYRVTPGCGHHDSWHSDVAEHRLVAMSINLSATAYRGGILQVRDHRSRRIIHEVANAGLGDAILLRVSDELQHRITDVEGTGSKTAFAGWFQSAPAFHSLLKPESNARRHR